MWSSSLVSRDANRKSLFNESIPWHSAVGKQLQIKLRDDEYPVAVPVFDTENTMQHNSNRIDANEELDISSLQSWRTIQRCERLTKTGCRNGSEGIFVIMSLPLVSLTVFVFVVVFVFFCCVLFMKSHFLYIITLPFRFVVPARYVCNEYAAHLCATGVVCLTRVLIRRSVSTLCVCQRWKFRRQSKCEYNFHLHDGTRRETGT